jgi:hypothetical protein
MSRRRQVKTPVWVWDWKLKKYLRLPPGLIQFSDGKWGIPNDPWPSNEMVDFHHEHHYLFQFEPDHLLLSWKRIILRQRGPEKYQPNKGKARIVRVQR